MPEMNPCQIDAMLTQSLDIAIAKLDLEKKYEICTMEASEKLVAAQTAWAEHKITCKFCYRLNSRGLSETGT